MKTKYPNQIDTSSELPIVRNNITEISAETFNSLRSAIIQIEKVLGINPQGSIGSTVASRVSGVIDDSGNIKPEALEKVGVLTSPVLDDHISKVAAIKESKLKLDFPTSVLQTEISYLSSTLDEIILQLETLNAIISAHVSPEALNRHLAKAITIEAIDDNPSSSAIMSVSESNNLQNIIANFVNNHINYNGDSISLNNNSHLASQIYFNNTGTILDSTDVQDAIIEVSDLTSEAIKEYFQFLNQNSILRYGKKEDLFTKKSTSEVLIDSTAISFSSGQESISTITFDVAQSNSSEIYRFDIVKISGAISEDDNKSYFINKINVDGSGKIESLEIYGSLRSNSSGAASAIVFKNQYSNLNPNGLNCCVRLRNGYTNHPDIVVANPNSATVISSGIRPDLLTLSNSTISIKIDDYNPIDVDCYNSDYSIQTIETIVDKINEIFFNNHLNAFAFALKTNNCFELAISHSVPNFVNDIKQRSITVNEGSTNNGIVELGFFSISGLKHIGLGGNASIINGEIFKSYQKIIEFFSNDVFINSGSNKISISSGSFYDYDIRSGDLIIITGSTESSDDGTFVVKSILETSIELDTTSAFSFAGELSENSSIIIIRSSIPLSELNFELVSEESGIMMIDCFANNNSDLFYNKRLEISNVLSLSGFFAIPIDISKNFILNNEEYILTVNSSGYAFLTDPDLSTGEQIYVGNTGEYNVVSPDGFNFVRIRVLSSSVPSSDISITLYGGSEIHPSALSLSRVVFSNTVGRIFGSVGTGGVPSILDKRSFGNIGINQISSAFVEKYIDGVRNEIRSSGVIRGCEVSNLGLSGDIVSFDISPGVLISSGIRREFLGLESLKIAKPGSNDYDPITNLFVVMDEFGCISTCEEFFVGSADISKSSFFNRRLCYLAYLDLNNLIIKDLRFFINDLDQKAASQIIVSEELSLGHFTSLKKAVDYARELPKIIKTSNNNMMRPSIFIREGRFNVSEQIVIDFDTSISGSGPNSVLVRSEGLLEVKVPYAWNFFYTAAAETSIFVIGTSDFKNSNKINYGVSFSNFTLESPLVVSADFNNFWISQEYSNNSSFRFNNITISGNNYRETDGDYADTFICLAQPIDTGSYDTSKLFGNILISGCKTNYVGGSEGFSSSLVFAFGNTIKNMIASSNIFLNVHPDKSSAYVFYVQSFSTSSGIIETGNVCEAT
jgi:hypothetical protein